jgi:EmrB/QacA subfamily drug resistance transporter
VQPADPQRRPTGVLVVLLAACISFSLAQTVVIPALPTIAADLDASPTAVSWVLTAFLLSASVSTPLMGRLGDLYGKGRVLTAVMLVFSAGAVINALADSIEVLIAGRVLQGVAGAVFPLSFGIVRDTFPPRQVPGGLALISAIFGIGGAIGLPLSGVIVDQADIAWLFWVSLLALPAALATHLLIPPSPRAERVRIDWAGAALLSVALCSILLGVSQADAWGWGSPATLGLIAGGLLTVFAFLRFEARVAEPFIDLAVLRQPAVRTTNIAGFLVGVAMFATFLIIPQFAQTPESAGYGFGASVTVAGLLLVPTALAQLLAGPVVARLGVRLGFRPVLAGGALLVSAGALVLAAAHETELELMAGGVLIGAGISFALGAMANLIVAVVPQSQVGIATGINTVMRTVGGSFGSAIAAALLAGHVHAGSPFPTESGYTIAFAFAAVAGLVAAGTALRLPRPRAPGAPEPAAERTAA